ncbi:MAG TPA: ABC-2 family transporter protein [Candidatus Ozemobacteraceae bacterium]|nr:ABC-2 family transporter protein [Candidatus Ozemobacteraceae bacterium]
MALKNSLSRLFLAHLQVTLAYRGQMLLWTMQEMLIPLVLMSAWLSIERVEGNPYGPGDYLLYYLALPIVRNLSDCWTVHSLPAQVREGVLSRELLKPMHPLWSHLFEHLAMKILQLGTFLVPLSALGWYYFDQLPALHLSLAKICLLGLVVLLAMALRFAMNTTLAFTGFWIEQVDSLHLVINSAFWAMMAGMVVPLETLPPAFRAVADLLPYRYTLSFPLEILRGGLPGVEILRGLLIGLLWLALLAWTGRGLWRRGLREYTAYGG